MDRTIYTLRARVHKLYQLRKRKAVEFLQKFSELVANPYFSMSWGKDSIVTYCLAREVFPDIRVIYVNCGKFDEWPDTDRVKQELCLRFNINLIEVESESVIESFRRVGYFYIPPARTPEEKRSDKIYGNNFFEAIAAVTQDCDGCIMGLRASESKNREALFTFRGPIYYRKQKGGHYVCCPIHDWSTDDIWAFHAEYDLPYNELYDCPVLNNDRRRNGAMFGGTGGARGSLQVVKRLYPDLFNEFAAEFPQARSYV